MTTNDTTTNPASLMDVLNSLEAEAIEGLVTANDADALEQWRITFLGTKGRLKKALSGMKDVPPAEKPAVGKRMNEVKTTLESKFAEKQAALVGGGGGGDVGGGAPGDDGGGPATDGKSKPAASGRGGGGVMLDITEPGLDLRIGKRHVLTRTMSELAEIFARMGFSVAHGPEVEDEWHNFVALNIPEDHPARDPMDNFYIDGRHLLRTQTSTVQIRVMEQVKPPVRIVSMGRVYRPDEVDATHSFMFHQIEGLYVDRNVSMVDLKTTLIQFAHAYFGPDAEIDLKPSFFPFTEPSAEMYVKMEVKGKMQWVELGGCGMVDPNVFKAVGYDPDEWTGFAFGLGIERIAMRKYGIPDIRWFYENNLSFLERV
ncbi:MAG: phenylalanine--tRNA ligase subunit alpha [Planctomycetota bacterium]